MLATLESDLRQFTGSDQYFRHFSGIIYTQGVKYLADNAGAYWLIDIIASHQDRKLRREGFQVWTLNVKDGKGQVDCRPHANRPATRHQDIEFTDFPLPTITLWVVDNVVMLPSEY